MTDLNLVFDLKVINEDGYDALVLSDALIRVLKETARKFHGVSFFELEKLIKKISAEKEISELIIDPEEMPEGDLRDLKLAAIEWFFKDRRNGIDFNSISWQYAQIRKLEKSIAAKKELGA